MYYVMTWQTTRSKIEVLTWNLKGEETSIFERFPCFSVTMEQTLRPSAAATRLDYIMLKIFARKKGVGIISTQWG